MTTTDYLVNAVLVLLVLRQIRTRRMDVVSLILPVVLVAGAAAYYLRAVPTAGHDVALDVILGAAGALIGALCAATTHVWRGADGRAYSRAGVAAGILWVLGVGARMGFVYASDHGAGPSIARFSASHAITSSDAWVAALVLMALAEVVARLVVLRLRGARAGLDQAAVPTAA